MTAVELVSPYAEYPSAMCPNPECAVRVRVSYIHNQLFTHRVGSHDLMTRSGAICSKSGVSVPATGGHR